MTEREELERAVIKAAQEWRRAGHRVAVSRALVEAVDALEASERHNEPTGFVGRRTWATVPAGWFVKAPGGWWEVVKTVRDGDMQHVTLDDGKGGRGTWPRLGMDVVVVRRGTLASTEIADAIETLGEGATINEDAL
jgi:hypothetical protein